MNSWERPKMPPLPGRRGTRRSLWKRAAAGLDEVSGSSCGAITQVRIAWKLELEPWVVHSPTRLDGGEQDAAAAPPGRRGIRGTRATKSTAA